MGMKNSIFNSIFKPVKFQPTKWTLVFLLASAMLILLGGAAVAPALPLISEAFPESSEATISLIVTLPSLAIALTGFFIGSLSDRIGRLPVLSVSLLIFTAAGISGFFLNSISAILAGRFILGIGIAGITTTTSALITDYYSGMTRTKVLGYQGASMGVGVLILEISGGFLAGISWRLSFLIYLIVLVIFIGVLATMKEPVKEHKTFSHASEGKEVVITEKDIINPLQKSSGKKPVNEILAVYITLFLSMIMFFLLPTKLPYLITDIIITAGLSEAGGIFSNAALLSGLFLGIIGLISALVGVIYWKIAGSMHRNFILVLTYLMFCCGFIALGLSHSLLLAGFAAVIIGVGNGLMMPTMLSWLTSVTPMAVMGRIMGGFSVALNIGQFASSLALVPVFAVVGTYSGLYLAFSVPAALLTIVYLAVYLRTRALNLAEPSPFQN